MTKAVVLIALSVMAAPATAESLDALLEEVRQNRQQVNADVQALLRQFREQPGNQAALLGDVQDRLSDLGLTSASRLVVLVSVVLLILSVIDAPGGLWSPSSPGQRRESRCDLEGEQRRVRCREREDQSIQAVEHSAVAREERARVLHPGIALQEGLRQVTQDRGSSEYDPDERRVHRVRISPSTADA